MHAQQLAARKRRGIFICVDEFNSVMAEHGAETPQEIARLLKCGESTVSRLRGHKQALSQDMQLQFVEMFGLQRATRICFGTRPTA